MAASLDASNGIIHGWIRNAPPIIDIFPNVVEAIPSLVMRTLDVVLAEPDSSSSNSSSHETQTHHPLPRARFERELP
ncbi:hypothetical protein SBV1_410076 [Verrucomicrobia bacterium]|nr:hypothetical protein SBV1_410076 [Verrucomicrobiota bacterium]